MTTTSPIVALAAGRAVIGSAVFLRPTLLVKGLGGDSATAERTAWLARMFAVRDFALGVGVLWALNRSRRGRAATLLGAGLDPMLRELLLLGVLCDAGDAVAVAGALRGGHVRPLPGGAALVTGLGAAAVGIAAATR
ncbi:MAG TPA: hypothetical protein VLR26_00720 [Frankiaceae bacterium]|nr:hypothetical protein [Frankiaceae bacterium]